LVESASGFFSVQLLPWVLRFLVVGLCFIAAARPQSGQKKVEEKKPVSDLFVALDISSSMVTPDLKPNRITAAKKFLADFLDKVENTRVGLTIFARISFTMCPLTTDAQVVKQLLSNVKQAPFSIKLDGTAIGDAIVACVGRLGKGDPNAQDKKTPSVPSFLSALSDKPKEVETTSIRHQAIILLTDGGDNASHVDPLKAAQIAASRGIKIYTVGMGSLRPVPALFLRPDGSYQYAIDQRTGQVYMSEPVEMGILKEIARITGAKAYSAQDNRTFQAVLDDIAKLEKRDVSMTTRWEYNELSPYFLLAAFALLVLTLLLETTVLRTLP
jgi:Ca-activated chloride channel family protein